MKFNLSSLNFVRGVRRLDLGSERPDLGPERSDLGSLRPDLGSKALFGVKRASFAVWEACFEAEGGDGRTDRNHRKLPYVESKIIDPLGLLPKRI